MTNHGPPEKSFSFKALRLFAATQEAPCPYLPGRRERKVITRLWRGQPAAEYGLLSRAGFRRSHTIAYRPACVACDACVPVRVLAEEFRASASQRRVARRNHDLVVREGPAQAGAEDYAVFARYVASRHGEGGMAAMSFQDYREMIEESPAESFVLQFRLESEAGPLLAACLTDRLDDGVSAVYSFFDPDLPSRSLGTFMVLELIRVTLSLGLPHVYLGYWIEDSPKMAYKTRFRPIEGLGENGWHTLG